MIDPKVQKYLRGRTASEISEGLEEAIRVGALRPAAKLPTVRGLAERLNVSPTTVAAAYRTLAHRGVVVADGRRGTRVSFAPPVPVSASAPLSDEIRDLAAGNPDPELLPRLAPALARLAACDTAPPLYGDATHSERLLELAEARLHGDGLRTDALSIVSGALDGIERVLQAQLRPGDRVAVEDPGFGGVLHLVRALGLTLVPMAVDDEGPLPGAVEAALDQGAAALIVTPRAQNPTGAALTPARVRAIRRVLKPHADCLLIEDDHAGEVAGAPAQTLVTRDTERFAVVRSVSKALGPDLRTAILAGDPQTVARVEGRQLLGLRWVSHVLQELVVDLWSDRKTARQLTRAEKTYTARRDALVEALAAREVPASGRSGMNVWIPVAEEAAVVQGLHARGWAVAAGERFRLQSAPGVRVTIATLAPEEAPRLADDIAAVLQPGASARLA
ncbi:MAG: aminotransferase class I/II-fold pyridoxal phosphate-dependent enzyme [Myxococcales bacterium]|nr:aminotransferase class I/II-fold pyridoxal phosphate-dependent enzyme [Myxococcales bacterium]